MFGAENKYIKKTFEKNVLDHITTYKLTKLNLKYYQNDKKEVESDYAEINTFTNVLFEKFKKFAKAIVLEQKLSSDQNHAKTKTELKNFINNQKQELAENISNFYYDRKINGLKNKFNNLLQARDFHTRQFELLKQNCNELLSQEKEMERHHRFKEFCSNTFSNIGKPNYFDADKELGTLVEIDFDVMFENGAKIKDIYNYVTQVKDHKWEKFNWNQFTF